MKNQEDERNLYGSRGGYVRDRRSDYNEDYGRTRVYGDYEDDYRQGVRGTGRYGMGGSMYNGRRDYNDYEYQNDYGEGMALSRKDIRRWGEKLKNADGSHGKHFDEDRLINESRKFGVAFDNFTEDEFVMTANMLYSDYCEALKGIVTPDKEYMVYSKMAKAFLEDKDSSVKGSEKLALYHLITSDDEEDERRR